MKKLLPILALAVAVPVALTSCTAVVETPAPTTASTTVRTERAVVTTPAATSTTTTTRASGY